GEKKPGRDQGDECRPGSRVGHIIRGRARQHADDLACRCRLGRLDRGTDAALVFIRERASLREMRHHQLPDAPPPADEPPPPEKPPPPQSPRPPPRPPP